jgi:3-oxoacyl-[acyl-carrier protein] reductase
VCEARKKEEQNMDKPLQGKAALVTGGSRGIGAATAWALAESGADVALTYFSSESQAREVVRGVVAHGVRAAAFAADQAHPEQVRAAVQGAHEHLGRLDIVVNNAAVFVVGRVNEPREDDSGFERQLTVNVGGMMTVVRAAVPLMADGGRIILIGSTAGLHVPFAGLADYAATKAAVIGYARGCARDLGSRRITVNVIQPGPIDTDLNPAGGPNEAYVRNTTALGRYGRAEEVAHAVTFLASARASYITGAVLDVDGGQSA